MQGVMSSGLKAAIIAEGVHSYSRSKLHLCLNGQALNAVDTSLSESRMTIDNNGNVGIGTTTPSVKLQVQCIVAAVSYTSTSDTRIKLNQHQVPYGDCKQIFNNVEVKKYTRTYIEHQRVGFIAQDLNAVCTNEFACIVGRLISTDEGSSGHLEVIHDSVDKPPNDDDDLLTVDYSRLVTVLWGVCKDLSTRLSELENSMNQKAKQKTYLNNNMYFVLVLLVADLLVLRYRLSLIEQPCHRQRF